MNVTRYDDGMSETVRHRRAYQNETFRSEVRFVDDVTGVPWEITDARMRGVMPLTDGVFDHLTGVDVELFEIIPTQGVDGWITAIVPQATMAICPVGVGRYDMVLDFGGDRMRAVGGSLQICEGISEWP